VAAEAPPRTTEPATTTTGAPPTSAPTTTVGGLTVLGGQVMVTPTGANSQTVRIDVALRNTGGEPTGVQAHVAVPAGATVVGITAAVERPGGGQADAACVVGNDRDARTLGPAPRPDVLPADLNAVRCPAIPNGAEAAMHLSVRTTGATWSPTSETVSVAPSLPVQRASPHTTQAAEGVVGRALS